MKKGEVVRLVSHSLKLARRNTFYKQQGQLTLLFPVFLGIDFLNGLKEFHHRGAFKLIVITIEEVWFGTLSTLFFFFRFVTLFKKTVTVFCATLRDPQKR